MTQRETKAIEMQKALVAQLDMEQQQVLWGFVAAWDFVAACSSTICGQLRVLVKMRKEI